MSTFTGYAWLLPLVVETAQQTGTKLKLWAQQEPEDVGVEMILNYPELEDSSKLRAEFRVLSRLYQVTGSVIDESFDETTKCVEIEDVNPILGTESVVKMLRAKRDRLLEQLGRGLL